MDGMYPDPIYHSIRHGEHSRPRRSACGGGPCFSHTSLQAASLVYRWGRRVRITEFIKLPRKVHCLQVILISMCVQRMIPGQGSLEILSSSEPRSCITELWTCTITRNWTIPLCAETPRRGRVVSVYATLSAHVRLSLAAARTRENDCPKLGLGARWCDGAQRPAGRHCKQQRARSQGGEAVHMSEGSVVCPPLRQSGRFPIATTDVTRTKKHQAGLFRSLVHFAHPLENN